MKAEVKILPRLLIAALVAALMLQPDGGQAAND